jgi:hypothetical protein
MAPTKAIARYAVTTLRLLTKGPKKAIGKSPWFTSLPANAQNSKRFRPDKVSPAALSRNPRREPPAAWLKIRENRALISP